MRAPPLSGSTWRQHIDLWIAQYNKVLGDKDEISFLVKLMQEKIAGPNGKVFTTAFADYFTSNPLGEIDVANFFLPLLPKETRNWKNETIPQILIDQFDKNTIFPLMKKWFQAAIAGGQRSEKESKNQSMPLASTLNTAGLKGTTLDYLNSIKDLSSKDDIAKLLKEYGAKTNEESLDKSEGIQGSIEQAAFMPPSSVPASSSNSFSSSHSSTMSSLLADDFSFSLNPSDPTSSTPLLSAPYGSFTGQQTAVLPVEFSKSERELKENRTKPKPQQASSCCFGWLWRKPASPPQVIDRPTVDNPSITTSPVNIRPGTDS